MGLEAYELKILDSLARANDGGGMTLDIDAEDTSCRLSDCCSDCYCFKDSAGVSELITSSFGSMLKDLEN